MSVRATSFVRRLRGLDATEKAVAFVYADHANHDTGDTYPAMDTVADEAGLADRATASRATKRLAEFRVILTDNPSKGGKPTVWRFNYGLQGCPSTITLAPFNRVPKSQSTVTKSHSPQPSNHDPRKPNCDPKQPNCDPESHKGVESKSKGKPTAEEEGEALRAKVAASSAGILQAFELLHTYTTPYGSDAFQLQWLAAVESSPDHEGDVLHDPVHARHFLPDTIERCIQACKRKRIKIPGPFYQDAKFARHWSGRFHTSGR